jgi:phenylacetate-CoA ligase
VLALEHAHTLSGLWHRPQAEREALRRFQVRKLRVLLAHSRLRVAIYGEHWRDSDLQPADITAPEAIEALPTISKNDLRQRPAAETLVDRAEARRLVVHMTSGSSGKPFTIYRSPREEHLLNLFRVRAYAAAGGRASDRLAYFKQLPLDGIRRSWPGRVRRSLGIYRDAQFDGLEPAAKMLERLAQYRPDIVCGYPSMLLHVAAWMQQHDPRRVRPRLLFCGGEVLDAATRRVIEDAFFAPLVDFYGAHEFNLLASQCPAGGGYHVCDDNVLIEVVDDDGRPVQVGASGEVVATALHSYTMPFVRYRTGDVAIRGPEVCACGQPFSTLRAIEGRDTDYLRLPGGRRIHPYAITGHLAEREAEWVWQHQLVQESTERVQLKVRPRRAPRPEDVERLRAFGAGILGADVQFEVALVDRFPPHPSGKFHPYLSLGTSP